MTHVPSLSWCHWFTCMVKAQVHFNPLKLVPPGPLRGLGCQEAGQVYDYVTTVIGCYDGHIIGKLLFASSDGEPLVTGNCEFALMHASMWPLGAKAHPSAKAYLHTASAKRLKMLILSMLPNV